MTEQDRYPDPFTADPEPHGMAFILLSVSFFWVGLSLALIARAAL